ncbi:hypothetical protein H632_c196p3, partial [Helicosporidium sp. ATCC 50920]
MTGWNSKAGSNRALDSLLSDFSGIEGSAFSKPKAMSDMKQSSLMRATGAQTEPNRDAGAVPLPSDPPAPDAARGHTETAAEFPTFALQSLVFEAASSHCFFLQSAEALSICIYGDAGRCIARAPAGLDSTWAPPLTQSTSVVWPRPETASFPAAEDDPFASFYSLSQAPRAPSRDSAHSAPSNLASAPACDADDLMPGFAALPERRSPAEPAAALGRRESPPGAFEPSQAGRGAFSSTPQVSSSGEAGQRPFSSTSQAFSSNQMSQRPLASTSQAFSSGPPPASGSPACSSRPAARGAFWDEAWVSEAQRSPPGSAAAGYFAAQGHGTPSLDASAATPPASSSTEKPLAEMRARAAKLWTSGSSWVRGIVHNPGLKVEHLRSGLHSVADHLAHVGRDPRRGSSESGPEPGPRAGRQEQDWREQEWGFQAEGRPWAES